MNRPARLVRAGMLPAATLPSMDPTLHGSPQHSSNNALRKISFRLIEPADHYDDYIESSVPLRGCWRVSAIYLPTPILRKVHYQNDASLLKLSHVRG